MSEVEKIGKAFTRGFAAALAEIIRMHGEESIAADVAREAGLDENALRQAGVEAYDRDPLLKALKS